MTKRSLLIAIPAVALLVNGVGYLIFVKTRTPAVVVTDSSLARTLPAGAPVAPAADRSAPPPSPPIDDEAAKESQAQARRAAGLAALEAGEYDKALINFTEAKALIGDKANVGDLLRVTEDLRRHPGRAGRTRGATGESGTGARRLASRSSTRRGALREESPEDTPPSVSPGPGPAGGLLIVTTSPRGLLVHVDDAPVDLTPMKTKVKAGTHRVSLLDGDRKVYETTVDVKEGGTATLLRDLSAERPAEAPRSTGAAAPSSAPVREEPRPTASPAASFDVTAATRPAMGGSSPADTAGALNGPGGQLGALEVSSPGLYGVVWVNGRPRGYPPLAVRDLPAGPVKVEVRVNGVQKRVTTVVVKPGLTTSVKLRSSESTR